MTETPATSDEIIQRLRDEAQKVADAAYQKGFDAASVDQDLRHWAGGQVTTGGNSERAQAAYEAELRPLIFGLEGEGVRGRRALDAHPDVVALKARHGRS